MDSKNQDNYLKKYDEKSLDRLQSKVIFTDPSYQFIFKKTEKIVAAIYLVTNLISDTEPLKWQIRKIALELMSDTLSLKRLPVSASKQAVMGLMVCASEIVSLLKVASISDQVSPMNASILQKEFGLLMSSLDSLYGEITGTGPSVLPHDFFAVPMPIISPLHSPTNSTFNNSNQPGVSSKGQYRTSIGQKDNNVQSTPKDNLKDNRREKMLQLLKTGKPLGIKDFAAEIKDCSEKTLQRELLAMVENGVLKKTGERRWSLYSLT